MTTKQAITETEFQAKMDKLRADYTEAISGTLPYILGMSARSEDEVSEHNQSVWSAFTPKLRDFKLALISFTGSRQNAAKWIELQVSQATRENASDTDEFLRMLRLKDGPTIPYLDKAIKETQDSLDDRDIWG